MNFIRVATLIAVASLLSTPLYAQDKAAAVRGTDRQAMKDECAKEHDKMHNHAKEKGMGDGMMTKCMNDKEKAKSTAKRPADDQNKERKTQ